MWFEVVVVVAAVERVSASECPQAQDETRPALELHSSHARALSLSLSLNDNVFVASLV